MPVREFDDAVGRRWKVWEVHPQMAERRRSAPDRRSSTRSERRRAQRARATLSPGLEQGWLAFETVGEKRRLYPIPERWEQRDDAGLVELLGSAEPAAPSRKTV